jgi:hypothetical protein
MEGGFLTTDHGYGRERMGGHDFHRLEPSFWIGLTGCGCETLWQFRQVVRSWSLKKWTDTSIGELRKALTLTD